MGKLLPNTIILLKTTLNRWSDMIDSIPGELLTRIPIEGEWSAVECLQHLIDTERWVFPSRVRAFLAGEDFPAFDPVSQGTVGKDHKASAELIAEFIQLRNESLLLLQKLTSRDLSRTSVHQELGKVTLGEMLNEWVAHDLVHTIQAERALMQPFINGCGPWKQYFHDHIISSRPN